jgi:RNA polymerase sigma-70 factor (ECF subfamily)
MSFSRARPLEHDAAARFEEDFRTYWPQVYGVLLRLTGNPAEAEDLALDTFWELYRRPPRHDRGTHLGGWLYRVATNLGLNALRADKRRARYELEAVQESALRTGNEPGDPVETIAAREERQRVRAVLGAMDPRHAQLLLLRHSGLAYKELAAALGLSINSIGALLVRAEREFETRYRQVTDDGRTKFGGTKFGRRS